MLCIQLKMPLSIFSISLLERIITNTKVVAAEDQKKIADMRASSIICPKHVDFRLSVFFFKNLLQFS